MIHPKEFQALRDQFNSIDTNLSGTIEAAELKAALKKSPDSHLTDAQIDEIVKQCDYDENGLINYHEFIAATFPVEKVLTKEKLQSLFHRFDLDESKAVSTMELKQAFTKLGIDLQSNEIDEILKEHDVDGDQQITFEEFEKMLKGAVGHN